MSIERLTSRPSGRVLIEREDWRIDVGWGMSRMSTDDDRLLTGWSIRKGEYCPIALL